MSWRSGRAANLRHRTSRALPALIVGVVLLASGAALSWIAITRLVNGAWPAFLAGPRDWLIGLAWGSPAVWAAGAVMAIIGLVLLLAAVVPGPFNALPLQSPGAGPPAQSPAAEQEIVMSRRAVARLASSYCRHLDGVVSASATATARRVHLSVTTPLHETDELRTRITAGVRQRLTMVGLDPVPRVTATIRSRGT